MEIYISKPKINKEWRPRELRRLQFNINYDNERKGSKEMRRGLGSGLNYVWPSYFIECKTNKQP